MNNMFNCSLSNPFANCGSWMGYTKLDEKKSQENTNPNSASTTTTTPDDANNPLKGKATADKNCCSWKAVGIGSAALITIAGIVALSIHYTNSYGRVAAGWNAMSASAAANMSAFSANATASWNAFAVSAAPHWNAFSAMAVSNWNAFSVSAAANWSAFSAQAAVYGNSAHAYASAQAASIAAHPHFVAASSAVSANPVAAVGVAIVVGLVVAGTIYYVRNSNTTVDPTLNQNKLQKTTEGDDAVLNFNNGVKDYQITYGKAVKETLPSLQGKIENLENTIIPGIKQEIRRNNQAIASQERVLDDLVEKATLLTGDQDEDAFAANEGFQADTRAEIERLNKETSALVGKLDKATSDLNLAKVDFDAIKGAVEAHELALQQKEQQALEQLLQQQQQQQINNNNNNNNNNNISQSGNDQTQPVVKEFAYEYKGQTLDEKAAVAKLTELKELHDVTIPAQIRRFAELHKQQDDRIGAINAELDALDKPATEQKEGEERQPLVEGKTKEALLEEGRKVEAAMVEIKKQHKDATAQLNEVRADYNALQTALKTYKAEQK